MKPQRATNEQQGRVLTADEVRRRLADLGKWFHNLDLCGVKTAPDHFLGDFPMVKWKRFSHAIPLNLGGKTVLDIGCNAGFYSFEMKRRGARKVVGIDPDSAYLAQARFASEIWDLDVDFRQLSVYEVAELDEQFDIVMFMGVLYHLRYPLLALDLVRRHTSKDMLVFQSMLRGVDQTDPIAADYNFEEEEIFNRAGAPRLHFIEHQFAGDPTNWWIPNRACIEAMLRSSGFEIVARPEHEVYVCRCS